jgi:hypothetical protein
VDARLTRVAHKSTAHAPFDGVLRSLAGEAVEAVGCADFRPDAVRLDLLRVVVPT